MKTWRIHFAWAIVTGLAAAVSARMAAPPEAGAPPRSAGPAPAPNPAEPRPPGVEAPAAEAGDDVAPTSLPQDASPAKAGAPMSERLRALMKSQNPWEELQKIAADIAQREAFLAALRDLLNDPDLQIQYYSLMMLRTLKAPESTRWVEAYLSTHLDKEDGSALNAIGTLGEIGDPGSIPVLREALQSKIEDNRLAAAQALQQLGDGGPARDYVAAMLRLFESPDGSLRKKAIEVISRFQSETGVSIFVRGLGDSNGDVRMQALWALANLGNRDYLPLLQPLLSDPNPDVAQQAAQAVEGLKSQQQ